MKRLLFLALCAAQTASVVPSALSTATAAATVTEREQPAALKEPTAKRTGTGRSGSYRDEMIRLVTLYDASRAQFNGELGAGVSPEIAASLARQNRQGILTRLNNISSVPSRYVSAHATFQQVVRDSIAAVETYAKSKDRDTLAKESARLTPQLQSVKSALGIRG
jgi:hypothetical protein